MTLGHLRRPLLALVVIGAIPVILLTLSPHARANTDACSGFRGIPTQGAPKAVANCRPDPSEWCFECVDTSLTGQQLQLCVIGSNFGDEPICVPVADISQIPPGFGQSRDPNAPLPPPFTPPPIGPSPPPDDDPNNQQTPPPSDGTPPPSSDSAPPI
jgi:hypothetical protein